MPNNPFSGANLYKDPNSEAAQFCQQNQGTQAALAIQQIANEAQSFWLTKDTQDMQVGVTQPLSQANGRLVTFAVYGTPAWGNNPAAYQSFIDAIAAAAQGYAPVFIVEPDALAGADPNAAPKLYQCLRYAIDTLAASGTVYLDVGHSNWNPAATTVARVNALGTTAHRGFSLNVSNFQFDADLQTYADNLLAATGKPSITDTSRNGYGPYTGGGGIDPDHNPPGRSIGLNPLTATLQTSAVDANLWIKRPGESDGLNNGGPTAGQFWAQYAVGLVTN